MRAHPLLGTRGRAGVRCRAIEETVAGAWVDDNRPVFAHPFLNGLELGDALHGRDVPIGASEEPDRGDVQMLKVRLRVEAFVRERRDLLRDLRFRGAWLRALASTCELLEVSHDAVLQNTRACDGQEGDVA